MEAQIENHQLNSELILYDSSFCAQVFHIRTLFITKKNNEIIKCHITFSVTPELYHRIETEALFNLKSELRTPLSNAG